MPDTVRFEEIQSLFAKLTAAFEDAAGVGANGQAAATISHARCRSESKNWKCFSTTITRSNIRALRGSKPDGTMMIAMIEPVQNYSIQRGCG
jgi:hypothetical protein